MNSKNNAVGFKEAAQPTLIKETINTIIKEAKASEKSPKAKKNSIKKRVRKVTEGKGGLKVYLRAYSTDGLGDTHKVCEGRGIFMREVKSIDDKQ